MATLGKIGKKGEVVIKKREREVAGLKPGDTVLMIARPGEVVIKKIYSLEELLKRPPVASAPVKEFLKERRALRKEMQQVAGEA